ncbi:MAG: threonyl-tRNA synthetase editing domain-containing protein, partial [Candidatus Thorarchaeota archaeon]
MRMLQIHSDGFAFEAKRKALKNAESIDSKSYSTDESCLVNFIAAETSDTTNLAQAALMTAQMIAQAADEVKEKKVIVYPWVHLSESPAQPSAALKLLKGVEKELKKQGYDVLRIPFGWYKSFMIHCKGHPLAERSKVLDITKVKLDAKGEITEGEDLTAIQAEQGVKSQFYIFTPDGEITEVKKFDYTGYEELRLYV